MNSGQKVTVRQGWPSPNEVLRPPHYNLIKPKNALKALSRGFPKTAALEHSPTSRAERKPGILFSFLEAFPQTLDRMQPRVHSRLPSKAPQGSCWLHFTEYVSRGGVENKHTGEL
jgi:hypothetical protein